MEKMDYSRLFQAIDYSFMPGMILKICLIVAMAAGLSYFLPKIKRPVLLIAFFLLVRIALFQNPLAWYTYARMLRVEDVGYRNRDCLRYEVSKYQKHPPVRLLAVGSSQLAATFLFPFRFPEDVQVRSMAGLGPVEIYMMRHDIAKLQPKYLLLYLSDFDLGRRPGLYGARTLPSQGWAFPKFWVDIHEQYELRDIDEFALREMAVGEVFPEYKYNFIFKEYLEMFAKRNEARREQVQEKFDEHALENAQLKSLRGLDEKMMPGNVFFLQELITYLHARNIGVILVEGQYRPDVYQGHNLETRDLAAAYLQELAEKNEDVYFFSRDQIRHFEVEEFADYYHVLREPAVEYTLQLMDKLPAEARPKEIPQTFERTDD